MSAQHENKEEVAEETIRMTLADFIITQLNIASVILKLRIIVYEYLVHLWTSTCLWILKHFLQKVYVKSDKQKKRLVVLNFKKYFNNGPKQNCSKAQKN